MGATIKDIAKETGLGLATISSYINGGNVREKNRIKIEEAIQKLDFEVNEVARGLKTNRTQTIGVVIPELNNIFCTQIITEMEDILRRHGYATIVCDCRTDKALEREAVDFLYRKRVDGLINMPVDMTGDHLLNFVKKGKPIVLIDREIQGISCDSVLVDNKAAAKQAVELLLESGHEAIGMIAGPKEISTARQRLEGYKEALSAAGIVQKESLIAYGDYTIAGAVSCLAALKEQNPDMTAVFTTNYEMTLGAMIYVNEHSIKVPRDISIIGFDNVEFAKATHPRLTIVTQPTGKIARNAAELMLKRLENREEGIIRQEIVKLQAELMMGKSVLKKEKRYEPISAGN